MKFYMLIKTNMLDLKNLSYVTVTREFWEHLSKIWNLCASIITKPMPLIYRLCLSKHCKYTIVKMVNISETFYCFFIWSYRQLLLQFLYWYCQFWLTPNHGFFLASICSAGFHSHGHRKFANLVNQRTCHYLVILDDMGG